MSEKVISFIFGALLGTAAGAGGCYIFLKKKMDIEMEKEKKELWSIVEKERAKNNEDRNDLLRTQQEMSERNQNKPSLDSFIFNENTKLTPEEKREASEAYHDYSSYSSEEENEDLYNDAEEDVAKDPDIEYISEEAFGITPDYDVRNWTFTANGVLLNDDLDPVPPSEMIETVGNDFDKHLDESTDGNVYIRNNRLMVEVEIRTSIETSNELSR